MASKEGLSGLIQRSSPTLPKSQSISNSGFLIGRVVDIILDENHPKFKELGSYSSIGAIIFENVGNSNLGSSTKIASPLFSNIKSYPIVGELVLLTQSPSPIQTSSNFTTSTYYISGINLWNSQHHNILPNPLKSDQDIVNTSNNPSQPTFIEKDNIYPLLFFTGDIIHEGRNGQSLRFGSTTKSDSIHKNTWSSVGNNGDPITILRNGQDPKIVQNGWVPITENINNDLSIICLTSTQKLEYNDIIIDKFNKFHTLGRSTTLNNFIQPQTLINSDRVVINAKDDSIFIGAKKHINFSTEGYTNFKSKNLYIDAKNCKLGDEDASESLVLGDSFMKDFNFLLQALNNLCTVLEVDTSWPGGIPSPNTPVNVAASALKSQVENISNKINLGRFTSKISKTI